MNRWLIFLWDVFLTSLSSFGGPEAHYGVFSNYLVNKKKYLTEEELSEMIGVFSLVPGPSSTQTIMAIGYFVGGPILATFTFLVWALPAIIIMTLVGVFFSLIQSQTIFSSITQILPPIAVGFIAYAGWSLSKKVVKNLEDIILFLTVIGLGLFLLPLTIWAVPILLLLAGFFKLIRHPAVAVQQKKSVPVQWGWLILILAIAVSSELLLILFFNPWIQLFTSFYRYGYSVVGGGQIVIPLMIQDLVRQQSLLSLETFLSGFAIDQAIPGPLFSFAAFVGAQILSNHPLSWLAGMMSGLSIFLPGILLVYFIFPLWRTLRQRIWMKTMLSGIRVAAASLIVLTAILQMIALSPTVITFGFFIATTVLLLWKKIPTPLVVILLLGVGLLF
jgi:chromate transporter